MASEIELEIIKVLVCGNREKLWQHCNEVGITQMCGNTRDGTSFSQNADVIKNSSII